jgi:glycosyltransferase involved in cell wall biosynthesis
VKLAWNAIVRNEAKIIERCVSSLLPHIDGAIVVDTGSSDDTVGILEDMFRAAGKPLELHGASFVHFEQARNEALMRARASALPWDYLLLADADMELKVHRHDWVNGAKGLSYDLKQSAGTLGYYNRRLVSRSATGWYVGVTHEYLDVATAGVLDGAEFLDHADGANRPEKFQRDIDLLEAALRVEKREGLRQRYTFYLAQSYFDAGNWGKASKFYLQRTKLGGYEEEVWNAQLHYAHCLGNMGDHAGFVWGMLQAYRLRPHRVEVLYDLAKYFRERGENHTSLLFSEPGMLVPPPQADQLFINDYVFKSGLKEEFAICAYYDPARRERGAKLCDELSLSRAGTDTSRQQARSNLYWYLKPLVQHVPSFRTTRIELLVPEGWVVTNPSVINHEGRPTAIVRSVNYTITPEGAYSTLGADGSFDRGHPIRTRNYLVRFTRDLKITGSHELALPGNWPEPKFDLVRGFEDSRLFCWDGTLCTLSTVRELTPEGWCEQVIAPVTAAGYGDNWAVVCPVERRHEKNWMPWVRDKRLDIVYRLGTLINPIGKIVRNHDCDLDVGHISGGSQVIEVEGNFLALVHEARSIPGRPHNRYYQHRFASLADDGSLLGISPPFVFHDRQIEFAAGLAYFPVTRRLMVSYGVRDCEAWLGEMDAFRVLDFIDQGWS